MEKEDLWLICVVFFSVVWPLAFGWGIFGWPSATLKTKALDAVYRQPGLLLFHRL